MTKTTGAHPIGRARPGTIVAAEALDGLPDPVGRYLSFTGVVGRPIVRRVALRQVGRIRSAQEKPWMNLKAEETYTTDPPSFDWKAVVPVLGVPVVRAHDFYLGGRGGMAVKAAGLFTLSDLRGPEMDQGSLMRYLNEMTWFPSAFLLPNVSWRGIDERSAGVTLTDRCRSVSATMFFDHEGRVTGFVAPRYRHLGKNQFSLEEWATPFTEYREVNGLRLPTAGRAEWRLDSGTLTYAELKLTALQYS